MAAVASLPSRRRRIALILFLWLVAAGLVLGQYLLLRHLFALDRQQAATTGHFLVPSPWWRMSGVAVPLMVAAAALMLQRRWLGGFWSGAASFGLVALVPFAAICLLLSYCLGAWALETARVAGRPPITLGVEDSMRDVSFILFEDADPGGFVWRKIDTLDHIDEGPFARPPSLVVSPDGRWLLARRGGIWTDAFRLVGGRPARITFGGAGEAYLPLRSERIAALTGLRP